MTPKAPAWLRLSFRDGVDERDATDFQKMENDRAYPSAHPLCWLAQFDPLERPCSGPLERMHIISRQRVENAMGALLPTHTVEAAGYSVAAMAEWGTFEWDPTEIILLAAWDPRNGGIACEAHHRRADSHLVPLPSERLVIPYDALPEHVLDFAATLSDSKDGEGREACQRCGGEGGWDSPDAMERGKLAAAGGHSPAAAGWVECPDCHGTGTKQPDPEGEALIDKVLERFRPTEAWWDMGEGHRQGIDWREVVGIVLHYGGALPATSQPSEDQALDGIHNWPAAEGQGEVELLRRERDKAQADLAAFEETLEQAQDFAEDHPEKIAALLPGGEVVEGLRAKLAEVREKLNGALVALRPGGAGATVAQWSIQDALGILDSTQPTPEKEAGDA